MVKIYFLFFTVLFFVADACRGQHLHESFGGIVRVETSTGRGTGFVVAKTSDQFEVWTNAHVAGKVGEQVVVRHHAGTKSQKSYAGVVAWSAYDGTRDAAKVLCKGSFSGDVIPVDSGSGDPELFITGGHPLGLRSYCLTVERKSGKDFGDVIAYVPSSIKGQSGSPIVNRAGRVVGVVTLKLGSGRNAVGGMLPVDHWTGNTNASVSVIGFGEFKPLSNAIVNIEDDHDGG